MHKKEDRSNNRKQTNNLNTYTVFSLWSPSTLKKKNVETNHDNHESAESSSALHETTQHHKASSAYCFFFFSRLFRHASPSPCVQENDASPHRRTSYWLRVGCSICIAYIFWQRRYKDSGNTEGGFFMSFLHVSLVLLKCKRWVQNMSFINR